MKHKCNINHRENLILYHQPKTEYSTYIRTRTAGVVIQEIKGVMGLTAIKNARESNLIWIRFSAISFTKEDKKHHENNEQNLRIKWSLAICDYKDPQKQLAFFPRKLLNIRRDLY